MPSFDRCERPGSHAAGLWDVDFAVHDVKNLMTVAHLFPASGGRRGIYKLHFAGGECYVGRSEDVVRRFGAHRRHYPDIVALEFARVGARADLVALEVEQIRSEGARGVRLRNKVHGTGDALADSDLDPLVTVDEQHSWLAGDEVPADIEGRVPDDTARRARKHAQYDALLAEPSGEFAVAVAQFYVANTIPRPRATEGTFWAASAMASTNATSESRRLISISVNKMETLVLSQDRSEPDLLGGFVNVRRSRLIEEYGSLARFARPRREWLQVQEASYESAGSDAVRMHATRGDSFDQLWVDEDNVGVLLAARALNLMLMRKGPTLQWRYHNFNLGDRLVAPIPDGETGP